MAATSRPEDGAPLKKVGNVSSDDEANDEPGDHPPANASWPKRIWAKSGLSFRILSVMFKYRPYPSCTSDKLMSG